MTNVDRCSLDDSYLRDRLGRPSFVNSLRLELSTPPQVGAYFFPLYPLYLTTDKLDKTKQKGTYFLETKPTPTFNGRAGIFEKHSLAFTRRVYMISLI